MGPFKLGGYVCTFVATTLADVPRSGHYRHWWVTQHELDEVVAVNQAGNLTLTTVTNLLAAFMKHAPANELHLGKLSVFPYVSGIDYGSGRHEAPLIGPTATKKAWAFNVGLALLRLLANPVGRLLLTSVFRGPKTVTILPRHAAITTMRSRRANRGKALHGARSTPACCLRLSSGPRELRGACSRMRRRCG